MASFFSWLDRFFNPRSPTPKKSSRKIIHKKKSTKKRTIVYSKKTPLIKTKPKTPLTPPKKSPKIIHTGQECVKLLQQFVKAPPTSVEFDLDELVEEKCVFTVPKVLVRMTSIHNPLHWYYLFGYRNGSWQELGGKKSTKTLVRRTDLTPDEIIKYLCQALLETNGEVRLEVDVSFKETSKKCDNIEWDPDTDDAIVKQTKLGHKNANILLFNNESSYDGNLFECTTAELKYIYDFHRNKQISIWDEKELQFQEGATRKERTGDEYKKWVVEVPSLNVEEEEEDNNEEESSLERRTRSYLRKQGLVK